MYSEAFPSRIKKARCDTGFTQRNVAIETGIPPSTIAKYETGKLEPDLEKLGILADFYGVSVDWLLGTNGVGKEAIIAEYQKRPMIDMVKWEKNHKPK